MAGYSGTPLATKLGIKAGATVHVDGAPEGYLSLLAPLPPDVRFVTRAGASTDLVHLFALRRARLAQRLSAYRSTLGPAAAVWVSWPKQRRRTAPRAATSPAVGTAMADSEITEHTIRELALPLGFVDVKVCAVDDTWSALKLVVRRSLRGALVLAAVLSLVAPSAAQPAGAPRTMADAGPSGKARISGRVVDATTGQPVARARVRLEGLRTPIPPVGTDETGRFDFPNLPACACAVSVDKAGYMPSRFPAGARTYRRTARTLTLGAGTELTDLVVPLNRGGSISGRVVDAFGDPVESARVQVLRLQADGAPQARPGATTDDRGEFRVARLDPGRYVLFVDHRNPPDDPIEQQPVPTFYPSALDMAQAQPLTVERGQALVGVELALLSGTTAWVTGVVVADDGQRAGGDRRAFVSAWRTGGAGVDYGQFPVEVLNDGTFRARLPPGEYDLEGRMGLRPAGGLPGPADERVGTLRIGVNGVPLSNLTLQLGAGAVMAGRIVFDGDGRPPERPSAGEVLVAAFQAPPGARCRRGGVQSGGGRRGAVQTDADWTFRIDGLFGTCVASIAAVNLGTWSVAAVEVGDTDVLDRPVAFDAGDVVRDVRIVLTDRTTQLALRVADDQDLPTREYVAVAFSTDPARWFADSRFVRVFQPSAGGRGGSAAPSTTSPGPPSIRAARDEADAVTGLPPGEYYAIAVDDLPVDAPRTPDTLARLARSATRITVGGREPAHVDLRRWSYEAVIAR